VLTGFSACRANGSIPRQTRTDRPAKAPGHHRDEERLERLGQGQRRQDGRQPFSQQGYNAGLIVPANATGGNTAPYITATFGGYAFYSSGLAAINYTGGNSTLEGLSSSGIVTSLLDGVTIFHLGGYGTATNVLLLSPAQGYSNIGTLVLTQPLAYSSLSILAASGNGYSGTSGQGYFVLTFTNASSSSPISFNAQDWYNSNTDVATTHFGRIYPGDYSSFYTDNPSNNNPNLYQTTVNLASSGLGTQAISSITFTMPFDVNNQNEDTGIFAISGTPAVIGPGSVLKATVQVGGAITLNWDTKIGFKYQMQYKTNLTQNSWMYFGNVYTATNTTGISFDTLEPGQCRFYRVSQLP